MKYRHLTRAWQADKASILYYEEMKRTGEKGWMI